MRKGEERTATSLYEERRGVDSNKSDETIERGKESILTGDERRAIGL